MIDKLRELNDRLIEAYSNDEVNLKKHVLIRKILNDDDCFFKMNIEHAYAILRDLKIEEDAIKSVYMKLIEPKQN